MNGIFPNNFQEKMVVLEKVYQNILKVKQKPLFLFPNVIK